MPTINWTCDLKKVGLAQDVASFAMIHNANMDRLCGIIGTIVDAVNGLNGIPVDIVNLKIAVNALRIARTIPPLTNGASVVLGSAPDTYTVTRTDLPLESVYGYQVTIPGDNTAKLHRLTTADGTVVSSYDLRLFDGYVVLYTQAPLTEALTLNLF